MAGDDGRVLFVGFDAKADRRTCRRRRGDVHALWHGTGADPRRSSSGAGRAADDAKTTRLVAPRNAFMPVRTSLDEAGQPVSAEPAVGRYGIRSSARMKDFTPSRPVISHTGLAARASRANVKHGQQRRRGSRTRRAAAPSPAPWRSGGVAVGELLTRTAGSPPRARGGGRAGGQGGHVARREVRRRLIDLGPGR
jgi:hypothetical protein